MTPPMTNVGTSSWTCTVSAETTASVDRYDIGPHDIRDECRGVRNARRVRAASADRARRSKPMPTCNHRLALS